MTRPLCPTARGSQTCPPAPTITTAVRRGHSGMCSKKGGVGGLDVVDVYEKWPQSIFPFVSFIFSIYEMQSRGQGGSKGRKGDPLVLRLSAVLIHPWGHWA